VQQILRSRVSPSPVPSTNQRPPPTNTYTHQNQTTLNTPQSQHKHTSYIPPSSSTSPPHLTPSRALTSAGRMRTLRLSVIHKTEIRRRAGPLAIRRRCSGLGVGERFLRSKPVRKRSHGQSSRGGSGRRRRVSSPARYVGGLVCAASFPDRTRVVEVVQIVSRRSKVAGMFGLNEICVLFFIINIMKSRPIVILRK